MEKKSRAEYFRKRRETRGQFMALVDKEKLRELDKALQRKGIARTAWLRRCIDAELDRSGEEN